MTTVERHALRAIVCCRVHRYNWDVLNNSVEKTQRVLILSNTFLPPFRSRSVDVSIALTQSAQRYKVLKKIKMLKSCQKLRLITLISKQKHLLLRCLQSCQTSLLRLITLISEQNFTIFLPVTRPPPLPPRSPSPPPHPQMRSKCDLNMKICR